VGARETGVEKPAKEIEREIDDVRVRLDKTLAELDRRRHELMDVKLQVRKHPETLAIAAGVLVLAAGGIYLAVRRTQKRNEPLERARRFRLATKRAVTRAVEHPERVAREPPVWEKIAAAVGTTIAVALTKRLLDRTLSPR
jgi:hypothetical protein